MNGSMFIFHRELDYGVQLSATKWPSKAYVVSSEDCSNFPVAASTTSTTSTMSMMTRTTTTTRKEMIKYKFNINDNECRIVESSIRSFRLGVLIYYICIINTLCGV